MDYDTVIKNARLVSGEKIELGIKNGKIKAVKKKITQTGKELISLPDNTFVSAGWIDSHVHCYEKMTLYYDHPDKVGYKSGVTTVIDAGSTGANNIRDFYDLSKQAITNVFALLNISEDGIVTQAELADLEKINQKKILETIKKLPEFIVGLKARMSRTVVGQNDIVPLEMAKKIQSKQAELPLMVHIGSAPPALKDILALLEKNDIVTHCFNGKANGILDQEEKIADFVWQAYQKGVVFDIGHGTDSFNFMVAEKAFKEKMKASTISTDSYHHNRTEGPVYNMATTLEKFYQLGYSLPELIEMITVRPAHYYHLKNKGHLAVDYDADVTFFTLDQKTKEQKDLIDSDGQVRQSKIRIKPQAVMIGGQLYELN